MLRLNARSLQPFNLKPFYPLWSAQLPPMHYEVNYSDKDTLEAAKTKTNAQLDIIKNFRANIAKITFKYPESVTVEPKITTAISICQIRTSHGIEDVSIPIDTNSADGNHVTLTMPSSPDPVITPIPLVPQSTKLDSDITKIIQSCTSILHTQPASEIKHDDYKNISLADPNSVDNYLNPLVRHTAKTWADNANAKIKQITDKIRYEESQKECIEWITDRGTNQETRMKDARSVDFIYAFHSAIPHRPPQLQLYSVPFTLLKSESNELICVNRTTGDTRLIKDREDTAQMGDEEARLSTYNDAEQTRNNCNNNSIKPLSKLITSNYSSIFYFSVFSLSSIVVLCLLVKLKEELEHEDQLQKAISVEKSRAAAFNKANTQASEVDTRGRAAEARAREAEVHSREAANAAARRRSSAFFNDSSDYYANPRRQSASTPSSLTTVVNNHYHTQANHKTAEPKPTNPKASTASEWAASRHSSPMQYQVTTPHEWAVNRKLSPVHYEIHNDSSTRATSLEI